MGACSRSTGREQHGRLLERFTQAEGWLLLLAACGIVAGLFHVLDYLRLSHPAAEERVELEVVAVSPAGSLRNRWYVCEVRYREKGTPAPKVGRLHTRWPHAVGERVVAAWQPDAPGVFGEVRPYEFVVLGLLPLGGGVLVLVLWMPRIGVFPRQARESERARTGEK